MSDTAVGIILLGSAAFMNANFTAPMKFTRKWQWEYTWLVWVIFALVIFPPLLAYFTVPDLGDVYLQAGWGKILMVAACGAAWGISQILLRFAIRSIGAGLAFAMVLGISAAVGGLVTLFTKHSDKVYSPSGFSTFAGIALILAGVAICAFAGKRRESALGTGPKEVRFGTGVLFSFVAGVCAAMLGLGLEWGGTIARAAKSVGAPEIWRANAVWLPLMVGAAVPNIIYCVYLIRDNKEGGSFRSGKGSHWVFAAIMAVLWFGSIVLYGISIIYLGTLGGMIAWPLFMAMIVIAAALIGLLTGEWRNVGTTPLRLQWVAVVVLLAAVIVLSRAV